MEWMLIDRNLWSHLTEPVPPGTFEIFGVPVYAHEPKVKRRKLDMKSKLGVFVGYIE